ncbi:MAG: hypothetical protein HF314_15055 [Ignavibacteria bacterium]|jgi:hypothetical protein|nr:hypothetical protein [Ignavibacteria bacterium]MCU7504399.1 hypothetical protein [Ignavibacteria bacterium]MCU7518160.1 hypothetical protein [Ignavibacteria bacterium]
MGAIVYWAIIRTIILIPVIWVLRSWVDYQFWWAMSFTLIYGVIIHPAVIQFKIFEETNKDIIESTLCSSCKYFDKTAVLCTKFDQHPTLENLPCEGMDWEPQVSEYNDEETEIK